MKNILLLMLVFHIALSSNAQWVQIGEDIYGNPGDGFGPVLVDINEQGNRIVIANAYSDLGDPNAGVVRVFDLVVDEWVQVGQDLQGNVYPSEAFGYSVAMSGTGEYIAVGIGESGIGEGKAGVYEYDGSNWVLKGSHINGNNTGDDLGTAIALSQDGLTLAISAPGDDGNGNRSGQVRAYQFQNGDWVQIGQDINGIQNDELGNAISINNAGNILAIAAQYASTANGTNTGKVVVYENQNDTWVQLGSNIIGDSPIDLLGRSLDLNGIGNRLVIGIPGVDDVGADNKGAVRVYEYDGNNWNHFGEDILGNRRQNLFGQSVGINDAGDAIIIGAPSYDPNNPYEGEIWFYKYNGTFWSQHGPSLLGSEIGDTLGVSVCISYSGDYIGAASGGAELNPGERNGKVGVYNTELLLGEQELTYNSTFNIFPNPTNKVLFMESTSEPIVALTVYSQLGQELIDLIVGEHRTSIDFSGYSNGIYFVKAIIGDITITKKILKN